MYLRRWEVRQVGTNKEIEEPLNHYFFFRFNARRRIKILNEVAENLDQDPVFRDSSYRYVLVDRLSNKVLQ